MSARSEAMQARYPGLSEQAAAGTPAAAEANASAELAAVDITKRFGGLNALDGVSLTLRAGEVHGLIGPNGSGKTTLLNLLCGYYRPTSGTVRLGDHDLSLATVQARAAAGVARTFQKPRLLPMLSVVHNAVLGAWSQARSGFLATTFAMPWVRREDEALLARATDLLHGVGLGHVLHRRANLLDHAEQRFLEIARALAMRPRFILLDEPAGGLTAQEIDHLTGILRTLRDCGIGVLLVEHHTDFVFRICDRVTTLNVGRMIRHGLPNEVRNDPEVIRVYLGA